MKFFMDTADVEAIKKAVELNMCDGVTTNPSLILKSGKDQKTAIQEIAPSPPYNLEQGIRRTLEWIRLNQ